MIQNFITRLILGKPKQGQEIFSRPVSFSTTNPPVKLPINVWYNTVLGR